MKIPTGSRGSTLAVRQRETVTEFPHDKRPECDVQPAMSKTADEAKRVLREKYKRLRADLSHDERRAADAAICANVCAHADFARADLVFAYLSFGAEIDMHGLIREAWRQGKTVAAPRVEPGTRKLRWYRIDSFEGLVKSPLGMEEPCCAPEREQPADDPRAKVALVPGLTFDGDGYRLGYGGGFYDLFLAGFKGASLGLCRRVQLHSGLREAGAVAPCDVPVDHVVTD